jgi:hypothetical protein
LGGLHSFTGERFEFFCVLVEPRSGGQEFIFNGRVGATLRDAQALLGLLS